MTTRGDAGQPEARPGVAAIGRRIVYYRRVSLVQGVTPWPYGEERSI
jgi:hypothetical protein